MEGSGADLRAVYITSIHIILNPTSSCNIADLLLFFFFFLGEAEQLLLRHPGFKHDDKVHRLPAAICENLINHQLEQDAQTVIRTYLLAYFSLKTTSVCISSFQVPERIWRLNSSGI